MSWESCPRCESKKSSSAKTLIFALGLGIASLCILFGFIFFPFWYVIPLGVAMMIAGPIMPATLYCKDCNHVWSVQKKGQQAAD